MSILRKILSFFVACSILLGFAFQGFATPRPEQYIADGEKQLFSQTVNGAIQAYNIFSEAQQYYPNHPVINTYLALTRIIRFVVDKNSEFNNLIAKYGIYEKGESLKDFEINITEKNGDPLLPLNAPSADEARSFLAKTIVPVLNESINNLTSAIDNWDQKYIISKDSLDSDIDIEVDASDIYLMRSGLRLIKCICLMISSYSWDIDSREIMALINLMGRFDPYYFLDKYPDALKLVKNGAAQLKEAKSTLLGVIEDYLQAVDMIKRDNDTTDGAEELVEFDQHFLDNEEKMIEEDLQALRDSLNNNTVADLVIGNTDDGKEKHLLINLSAYFDKAHNFRDYLPQFNIIGKVLYGTVAHGIGDDPTLDGILPEFNQERWAEILRAKDGPVYARTSIPNKTINIKDSSLDDWNGINSIFQDRSGDADPDLPGSDIKALYLAKDDNYLYGRIDLDNPPDNEVTYSVAFKSTPQQWADLYINIQFIPGKGWLVKGPSPWEIEYSGYAKVTGSSLEWKIPIPDLSFIEGDYLSVNSSKDHNTTCIQIAKQLGTISGKLNVPGFNGKGVIRIAVFKVHQGGETDLDPEDSIRSKTIYPDQYQRGMIYTIDDLPIGSKIFITAWWDKDFSGTWTYGDYSDMAGPFTVTAQGINNADLHLVTMYAVDKENPRFMLCRLVSLRQGNTQGTRIIASVAVPEGKLPDAIDSIIVTAPNGSEYELQSGDYDPIFMAYIKDIPTLLLKGEYVFRVTDKEGHSTESRCYFAAEQPPTFPANLQASGDPLAPVLSWTAPQDYQGHLLYQVQVFDSNNNLIWMSEVTYNTSVKVPKGVLKQGNTYKWQLWAMDSEMYVPYGWRQSFLEDSLWMPEQGSMKIEWWPYQPWFPDQAQKPQFVMYQVEIHKNSSDGPVVWVSDVVAGTSVDVPEGVLTPDHDYSYVVYAVSPVNFDVYAGLKKMAIGEPALLNLDTQKPFFKLVRISHSRNSEDKIRVRVRVGDPDGSLPDAIDHINVYDPGDSLLCSLTPDDYNATRGRFQKDIDGKPASGIYKIVVEDRDGNTKTTYEYVAPAFDIPCVDNNTMKATGDPLSPVLSWSAPQGMDRPIYFWVVIKDADENTVWTSPFIATTSIVVPKGVLQEGLNYQWQVRTADSFFVGGFSNQGRSNWIALDVENKKPFFNWAAVYKARVNPDYFFPGIKPSAPVIGDKSSQVYTVFNVSISVPNGTLPDSITSLTVTDPDGNSYDLLHDGRFIPYIPNPNGSYFFLFKSGAPVQGEYRFEAKDAEGNTIISYDWVNSSSDMPVVEQSSIATMHSWDFTYYWSGVHGYNSYADYRLMLYDYSGNLAYTTEQGKPYTWGRVENNWWEEICGLTVEASNKPLFQVYDSVSYSNWVTSTTEGFSRVVPQETGLINLHLGNADMEFDQDKGKYVIKYSFWLEDVPFEQWEQWEQKEIPVGILVDDELKGTVLVKGQDSWDPPPIEIAPAWLAGTEDKIIKICVDPMNQIRESNEADNSASFVYIPPEKGDVDGDHLVTIQDAIIVLQVVAGNEPAVALNVLRGDMDGDNKLGIPDAISILRKCAQ